MLNVLIIHIHSPRQYILIGLNNTLITNYTKTSIRKDILIQKTITEEFHDCTLIVIVHRLNTFMHSDRIMVSILISVLISYNIYMQIINIKL